MKFTKLIEKISNEYEISIVSLKEDLEIRDVMLLDYKHCNAQKHTLYFGYDTQLEQTKELPAQCVIAHANLATNDFTATGNVATVSYENLFPLFNAVRTLVETTRSKGIFDELTALSDATHSIDTLIDAASVRLGNSLLFCDMNFKVIASSTTIPVCDPLWIENIKQGYCSYEFISEVKELTVVKYAAPTTTSIEVSCQRSPYRKLSCKVFNNQRQIGFLLMIESETPILPSHFELLSTVSHVISYTISYYAPYLFEENNSYNELLYDMLIGTPYKNIMPRLKELSFPSQMLVLFIRSTIYMGQEHLTTFTHKLLKEIIPGTLATYHNKGIVAIIPLKNSLVVEEELLTLLKNFSQTEHLRIGISNSFSNIEHFVNYYQQAHSALEMGQKLKTKDLVCQYQDYQIFDLFTEIKNQEQLGRFCHPALGLLRHYDYKNGSQLYKTLCVFIDKGCNIKLTSESLFIHRNSLVYRLNRINEICHIDFTDMNTLFLLRLSFLIDRYNELNTNAEWQ